MCINVMNYYAGDDRLPALLTRTPMCSMCLSIDKLVGNGWRATSKLHERGGVGDQEGRLGRRGRV